jgi:hypothetical protein
MKNCPTQIKLAEKEQKEYETLKVNGKRWQIFSTFLKQIKDLSSPES